MKAPLLKLLVFGAFICLVFGIMGQAAEKTDPEWMGQEAIAIAEKSPDVMGLRNIMGDFAEQCLDINTELACESEHVTCVEEPDVWVVQYALKNSCPIQAGERFNVLLLMSVPDQRIISRFPGREYFDGPFYCRDDFDCLPVTGAQSCANFMHAHFDPFQVREESSLKCQCVENQCNFVRYIDIDYGKMKW